jgi:hypothetical protein
LGFIIARLPRRKISELKRITATFLAALFLTCATLAAAAPKIDNSLVDQLVEE